jgi:hypothetical protein
LGQVVQLVLPLKQFVAPQVPTAFLLLLQVLVGGMAVDQVFQVAEQVVQVEALI